jgi:hypothetical protein
LTKAVLVKLIGTVGFVLVYTFYYDGGDTTAYFQGAKVITNLYAQNPQVATSILLGDLSPENYSLFNYQTGYPPYYMWRDPHTFSVCRYSVPFVFLSFKTFMGASILLSMLTFIAIWRFYLLLVKLYPHLSKEMAIAVLFIPSVVFWGSGIMKDTYAFGALCLFLVVFYNLFVERRKLVINILLILVTINFMMNVKPYILYTLIPGALTWLSFNRIAAIKNIVLKIMLGPVLLGFGGIAAFFVLSNMSDLFGKFSMDKAIDQAKVQQEDLKRDVYGENSFDIGEIDGSIGGLVSLAPKAINAALFRPYLFEARSAMIFITGVENTLFLLLTLYIFFKGKFFGVFYHIRKDPYLIFAVSFTILFAFMVGISTANFGAMVRYKIPFMPFFLSALLIIRSRLMTNKSNITK